MKLPWYKSKQVIRLLHIASWTVLFSLPYLLKPSYNNSKPQPAHNPHFDYLYIISCSTWIGLFYLNAYILVPLLINKKKYRLYLISLVAVIALFFLINWLSFNLMLPDQQFQIRGFAFFYVFPCLFILATSTAFTMFREKAALDRQTKEKETENLKTELSFLRSQVSPHFMFNVLNNMVALARKKSDLLEPSLIKLSSLLRYMLYETDEEKVALDKEVEYLQSYIDLQQQRFGKKVAVHTCLQHIDKPYAIEPMLLIPFVENAFKHGTGLVENASIVIDLKAENNVLLFSVANKYNPKAEEVKDKTSGIGLNNVTRRLNLLYNKNHALTIHKNEGQFTVALQLNLH